MTREVVLVGPPGAGKSSVGAELARRWGVGLVDTDAVVEAEQGCTISDIFIDRGEAAFRELEEAAVAKALGNGRPSDGDGARVVALGGGAVLSAPTRELLTVHPVVFLDVGLATCVRRVGLGVSRPLVLGNVRARLKALLDERRELYLAVARVVVPTDDLSVAEVADRVESWCRCPAT